MGSCQWHTQLLSFKRQKREADIPTCYFFALWKELQRELQSYKKTFYLTPSWEWSSPSIDGSTSVCKYKHALTILIWPDWMTYHCYHSLRRREVLLAFSHGLILLSPNRSYIWEWDQPGAMERMVKLIVSSLSKNVFFFLDLSVLRCYIDTD